MKILNYYSLEIINIHVSQWVRHAHNFSGPGLNFEGLGISV